MIAASQRNTFPQHITRWVTVGVVMLMLVGGCSAQVAESTPTSPDLQPSSEPVTNQAAEAEAVLRCGDGADSQLTVGVATSTVGQGVMGRESAALFAAEVSERTEAMFYAPNPELATIFAATFHAPEAEVLVEQLVAELEPVRAALADAPTRQRTWFAVRALSTEVTNFDTTARTATVEVWVTQVFSRQGITEPTATYETQTIELVWTGEGWRVTKWGSLPGPSARLSISVFPSTAVELDRLLDGHRLLHDQESS